MQLTMIEKVGTKEVDSMKAKLAHDGVYMKAKLAEKAFGLRN